MGFIGDVFSGDKGAGYQAQGTDLLQGVDPTQIQNLYNQSQSGLGQQQAFLNALAGQNGIGNQNSVFAQQQGLANQLGDQAQGIGPNPAQAMLNQATGQNVANQQALMASQRGANANAGLIARQAAMQGAGIQQNAIGQGAVLQAQQQLAARQQLQQQQQMMQGLSSQQIAQQQGGLLGYNQMAQNQYGLSQDALSKQNAARVAMQGNVNNANAGVAGVNAKGQGDATAGLISGAGSAAMMAMAEGGIVPDGSNIGELEPESYMGKFLKGFGDSLKPSSSSSSMNQAGNTAGQAVGGGLAKLMSPSGSPQTDASFQSPQMGSQFAGSAPKLMQSGGKVPGHAQVPGNSFSNDKVPAVLSPGEVVIPRSVMQSADPAKAAQQFVQALLAKNKRKPGVK